LLLDDVGDDDIYKEPRTRIRSPPRKGRPRIEDDRQRSTSDLPRDMIGTRASENPILPSTSTGYSLSDLHDPLHLPRQLALVDARTGMPAGRAGYLSPGHTMPSLPNHYSRLQGPTVQPPATNPVARPRSTSAYYAAQGSSSAGPTEDRNHPSIHRRAYSGMNEDSRHQRIDGGSESTRNRSTVDRQATDLPTTSIPGPSRISSFFARINSPSPPRRRASETEARGDVLR
jgi:hypothetical protein